MTITNITASIHYITFDLMLKGIDRDLASPDIWNIKKAIIGDDYYDLMTKIQVVIDHVD